MNLRRLIRQVAFISTLAMVSTMLALSHSGLVWAGGSLTATPTLPPGGTVGVRHVGSPPVTTTVADIMSLQRQVGAGEIKLPPVISPPSPAIPMSQNHNPDSPAVAQFSRAGTEASSTFPKISYPARYSAFLGAVWAERILQGFPPDTMGAVGPTQFMLTINSTIKTFNKSGTLDGVLNVDIGSFFFAVNRQFSVSDPQVRYDRLSGRWFVTIITVPPSGANQLFLAVSDTQTITASTVWSFYSFPQNPIATLCSGQIQFLDQPWLGIDASALYVGFTISCTNPNGNFNQNGAFVINKASLLSGSLVWYPFSLGSFLVGNPRGVDNFDPNPISGFFIGADGQLLGRLRLWQVLSPGGTPVLGPTFSLNVPDMCSPLFAPQPGSKPLDARIFLMQATIRNQQLWTSHTIATNAMGVGTACGNGNNRDAMRWYQIDISNPNSPLLVNAGTVYDNQPSNPLNYIYGSVMVSGQGELGMGMTTTGTSFSPSASTILAATPPGSYARADYRPGSGGYTAPRDNLPGKYRWGDYSYTSLDPCDDMTMWTIQEYSDTSANLWGVEIGVLQAAPPIVSSASPPNVVRGQQPVNLTINGTGFYDTPSQGMDSCQKHLAVTSNNPGLTVSSLSNISPTQMTVTVSALAAMAGSSVTLTITNPDGQSVSTNINIISPSVTPTATGSLTATSTPTLSTFTPTPAITITPGSQTPQATPDITPTATVALTPGTFDGNQCTQSMLEFALNHGGTNAYPFNCTSITLNSPELVNRDVWITGPSANSHLDITNNGLGTVFIINYQVSFHLTNITIHGGNSPQGGAISNSGRLILDNVSLNHNTVLDRGGAINNERTGQITINNSTISDNTASSNGGGIYNDGGLGIQITNSTIANNLSATAPSGAGAGGGIYSKDGGINITNSAIYNNSAGTANGNGGGLYIEAGGVTITNSTIYNNSAGTANGNGGGLYINASGALPAIASATIAYSTIANNSAIIGKDIYNVSTAGGKVTVLGTIVAGSTGGNCSGTITALGYNLESTPNPASCGLERVGDPMLGALQNNGGPTFTVLIPSNSIAVGMGGPNCPTTDQRGMPRKNPCDIGAYETQKLPPTPVVNTLNDSDDGACTTILCSLRDAIKYSQSGARVTFAVNVNGIIPLNSSLGSLSITHSLTIDGTGHTITVDGGNAVRVLNIDGISGGVIVNLNSLIFKNGLANVASLCGAGIHVSFSTTVISNSVISNNLSNRDGGGLCNYKGNITITNSTISNNTAQSSFGGGIYNQGLISIVNSFMSGNHAVEGGGIANEHDAGMLYIEKSTISGNSADDQGGGIYNQNTAGLQLPPASLTISQSLVFNNTANYGGGIYNESAATVINVTLMGNTAQTAGGGIRNYQYAGFPAVMSIVNGTIASNTSPSGAGIQTTGKTSAIATTALQNTLIANNSDGSNVYGECVGYITDNFNNLQYPDSTCQTSGTIINLATGPLHFVPTGDPGLGSLRDNGGSTWTMAITGSAAIDQGNPNGCNNSAGALLAADQRGYFRQVNQVNGRCDIGAFEKDSSPHPIIDGVGVLTQTGSTFYLRQSPSQSIQFSYNPAASATTQLAGEWSPQAVTTVGLYDPSTGTFYLRNSNSTGSADLTFQYGPGGQGLIPIVGDWTGKGYKSVGLYSPASGYFYLHNSNDPTGTNYDIVFQYGSGGSDLIPIVGDWTGKGYDSVGLYSLSNAYFYLKNSNSSGNADLAFQFGPANISLPVTGKWISTATATTIGVYIPSNTFFYLKNSNSAGNADLAFQFGPQYGTAVTGHWGPVPPTNIAISPTTTINGSLGFISNRDGQWGIYRLNGDDSHSQRLTIIGSNPVESRPAWLPDGTQIAFVSDKSGNPEIYVMNADGSNVRRLTYTHALNYQPAWSPNGKRIAFVSNRDNTINLYVMDSTGSNVQQLTHGIGITSEQPAWSPDGKVIAYSTGTGTLNIAVMNESGSKTQLLTQNGRQPAWSPDGKHIAFVSTRDGNSQIYVMSADGSNVQRLTNNTAQDTLPVWLPR